MLATNDDNAVQCWLRLEQRACTRKLIALRAELKKVCSEYSIELTTEKKEYHFKFPTFSVAAWIASAVQDAEDEDEKTPQKPVVPSKTKRAQ